MASPFFSLTASACALRTTFLIYRPLSEPRLARRSISVSENATADLGSRADVMGAFGAAMLNDEGATAATRSRNILKMARRALKSSPWYCAYVLGH